MCGVKGRDIWTITKFSIGHMGHGDQKTAVASILILKMCKRLVYHKSGRNANMRKFRKLCVGGVKKEEVINLTQIQRAHHTGLCLLCSSVCWNYRVLNHPNGDSNRWSYRVMGPWLLLLTSGTVTLTSSHSLPIPRPDMDGYCPFDSSKLLK